MPAPVAIGLGVAAGVAGSLAYEYIFSAGKATRRDYAVAAAVGAFPVGFGLTKVPRTVTKLGDVARLGYYSRKAKRGKDVMYYGTRPDVYQTRRLFYSDATLYFTPEMALVAGGVVVGSTAGHMYDLTVGSSYGPSVITESYITQSQLGSGRNTSQPSRKPARVGKIGRRKKRCTHKDSRGRRCLRPAGHSGRHRYV